MTAVLMGICVVTAACLYVPQLAELVGRRALVVTLHQWAGLALPVPVLAALASRAFRADLGCLNRFGPHDRPGCAPPCAATNAGVPPRGQVQRRPEALRGLDRRRDAGDARHRA